MKTKFINCITTHKFNDIRGYSLFTRVWGYKYDRGTKPCLILWGGGAYKNPAHPDELMRVVTESILLVYCRDCLFKKIATTWNISLIYMQFHLLQF